MLDLRTTLTLFGFLLCSTSVMSYKILMICTPPVKSHHILCTGVVNTLAEKGHEITFISPYPPKRILPNIRNIVIDLKSHADQFPNAFQMANMSTLDGIKMMTNWSPLVTKVLFSNADVIELINSNTEKFDVFILEYFMNENLMGFSAKFNCPIVFLTSVGIFPWLATVTGSPLSIATNPIYLTTFSNEMNILQRAANGLWIFTQLAFDWFVFKPIHTSIYNEYFPLESQKVSFNDLYDKISAVLVNTHPSIGYPRPLMPNTVEVGGFHIEKPEPLPKDLQTVIDNSKNGVIFFSLGSIVSTDQMSPEIKQSIINTFSKLKQTVLWKLDTDLPNIPKNVIIKDWMPQTSILAHPNVKLFITHGGLLSCTEASYSGVPMVIIPVFGDQPHNAAMFSKKGQGVSVTYDNVTETSLYWAINEVLNNPKYAENAKRTQKIYHDRPISPRDLLAHHVEHVIRTDGASHLAKPKIFLFSELLLDIGIILLIILVLNFKLTRYFCRKCYRENKNSNKERPKNKIE